MKHNRFLIFTVLLPLLLLMLVPSLLVAGKVDAAENGACFDDKGNTGWLCSDVEFRWYRDIPDLTNGGVATEGSFNGNYILGLGLGEDGRPTFKFIARYHETDNGTLRYTATSITSGIQQVRVVAGTPNSASIELISGGSVISQMTVPLGGTPHEDAILSDSNPDGGTISASVTLALTTPNEVEIKIGEVWVKVYDEASGELRYVEAAQTASPDTPNGFIPVGSTSVTLTAPPINDVIPGGYIICTSTSSGPSLDSDEDCDRRGVEAGETYSVSLLLSDRDSEILSGFISASGGDTTTTDPDLEIGCTAESGSFGWIVCPLIEGVLNFTNFMAGLIGNFLQVSPVQFDENGANNAQYKIWQTFRNLSLGLLMIAMLVMVFGQSLSLNIDAYTVKKMLPRIVIATIAVMLSIYVIAFAVDFFNILGAGIADLVTAPLGNIDIRVGGFGDFAGVLLGIFATGVAIKGIGIAGFVLVVLIPIALAFLTVYLTLVFRQVVIVMLIIVAPLAFVAWTIPGTEKYFKTWSSTLIKALMMYPLIMLLLASGQVFAVIVTNGNTGNPGWLNTITALVAIAVPMFFVPATFKMAGGAISMASGALDKARSNYRQRLSDPNDRAGRTLKKQRAIHDQKKDTNRAIKAQGLHYKSGQGFKNKLRILQRAGAAGVLLASGAGRAAVVKDAYAAINQTEEEMNAQAQNNPYAFRDYLQFGHDKKMLEKRVTKLRADGNYGQADQLERLGGTFGTGNQAAAAAMVKSLGNIGKLNDASIHGAGQMFGGKIITGEDGKEVLHFGNNQARSAATFSNIITDAGFAATGKGQWQYRNAAVISASKSLNNGGATSGFVMDRQGNTAVGPDSATYTGHEQADWTDIVSKIPSISRATPDAVKTLAPSIVSNINRDPNSSQAQAVIRQLAQTQGPYSGALPELTKEAQDSVISKLEGDALTAYNAELERQTRGGVAMTGDEGEVVIPGPARTGRSPRSSGSTGSDAGATTSPRIIQPGDPDYKPPSSSDLPGGSK